MLRAREKIINVVMAGHVDHGKSTVLGRMLADTGSLPKGKLEQVKATCQRNSKPFEYAFLIDALKDEQAQGITIDSARVFFKTKKREYLIIDAPGHIDFLKNMVTGAARAEAAFLVIDAAEGVRENSKRHGFLLSMLGIKQIAVIVNKMDIVAYDKTKFENITKEYKAFLERIKIDPLAFIPVSGREGDNVVKLSDPMPWYKGKTVLETIDMFQAENLPIDKPFRMPVQGVYKFTKWGDDRRIIAGTVVTGKINVGDEIIFYPSGKTSRVKTIEAFNANARNQAVAGEATGLTLDEQIYVTRGQTATTLEDPRPNVTSRVKVSLFWLGKRPMSLEKEYIFKIGTAKVGGRLETIEKVFDTSDLDANITKNVIETNMLAECILKLNRPLAIDLVSDFQQTSRFVIVDNYNISGGGIIHEALKDEQSWVRDKVLLRNYKWIKSMIPHADRTQKYDQESTVVFITGKHGAGRKSIAKRLEEDLFKEDRLVYYLGIGNILYGVDADIKEAGDSREEHIRRLAEVSHILLDAGIILLVTAIELTQEDLDLIRTAMGEGKIETVWIGKDITTDIKVDLKIDNPKDVEKAVVRIKKMLVDKGIIHSEF